MNHEVRVVRLWKEMLEFIQDAQIARAWTMNSQYWILACTYSW
jgi:hypothetical protein